MSEENSAFLRLYQASNAFVAELKEIGPIVSDDGEITEALSEFCDLPPDMAAELLYAMMSNFESRKDSTINLHLVGAVAEAIGPDLAQTLYNFAVKVTKIA